MPPRKQTKPRPRKQRKNSKRTVKLSKPLKNAISNVINGTMETKYRAESLRRPDGNNLLTNFRQFTSAVTSVNEIYSLLPTLSEGAGSFQRNGVIVFPKKLRVHLNIVSTQSNLINADYMVYAFFLHAVAVKDLANYTAIPITSLMENGSGGFTTFDGTSQTSLYKINDQAFRVIRVIKKRIIYNVPIGAAALAQAVAQDHTQDHHNIQFDVPLPKRFVYPNETASYPTNFAPIMVLGFIDNTWRGDTAPGATESVSVEGRSELWFKDA